MVTQTPINMSPEDLDAIVRRTESEAARYGYGWSVGVITAVHPYDADPRRASISFENVAEGSTFGNSTAIEVPPDMDPPKVGDIYGSWTVRGSLKVGASLNGKILFFRIPEEEDKRHREWVENLHRERQEELDRDRSERDARRAALPPEFRARLRRFEDEGGEEFRRDSESYELFAIEQSWLLARRALLETMRGEDYTLGEIPNEMTTLDEAWRRRAIEWIDGWWAVYSGGRRRDEIVDGKPDDWAGWAPFREAREEYDYDRQRELCPEWSDGHSGNTAGAAYFYAKRLLAGEDV